MKLHVLTIVLDGMPTLPMIFANLNALKGVDWMWHVVEGSADNSNDTSWCQKQLPRYGEDGTHEFLQMLDRHPRVHLMWKKWWSGGKTQMVNAPLYAITEESILLQCDADEIWTPDQLTKLVAMFEERPGLTEAAFYCRYFCGVNIVTITDNAYGSQATEWVRAWRFTPGDKFVSHEPPTLQHKLPHLQAPRDQTRILGLVFDHYSWAFPNQIGYKELFYGYGGAMTGWTMLQENANWPVRLKNFFPWVDDRVKVDLLNKPR